MTLTADDLLGLGHRQLATIKALERRGPMGMARLAEAVYGSRHRTTDARKSAEALEARGLVVITREGRSTTVALAEEP